MQELTDQELLRYHRQINLRSVDIDGQTALKKCTRAGGRSGRSWLCCRAISDYRGCRATHVGGW